MVLGIVHPVCASEKSLISDTGYGIAYNIYHHNALDLSFHFMYLKLKLDMWSPRYTQKRKSKANRTEITVVYP